MFRCDGCGQLGNFITHLTTRWGAAWICSLACAAQAVVNIRIAVEAEALRH